MKKVYPEPWLCLGVRVGERELVKVVHGQRSVDILCLFVYQSRHVCRRFGLNRRGFSFSPDSTASSTQQQQQQRSIVLYDIMISKYCISCQAA
jgi:hypothetical protein